MVAAIAKPSGSLLLSASWAARRQRRQQQQRQRRPAAPCARQPPAGRAARSAISRSTTSSSGHQRQQPRLQVDLGRAGEAGFDDAGGQGAERRQGGDAGGEVEGAPGVAAAVEAGRMARRGRAERDLGRRRGRGGGGRRRRRPKPSSVSSGGSACSAAVAATPSLSATSRRSISTNRPESGRFDQSALAVVWNSTTQPLPRVRRRSPAACRRPAAPRSCRRGRGRARPAPGAAP